MSYSNAMLIHGKTPEEKYLDPRQPLPGIDHYHQWCADRLGERGITTYMPTLPRAYHPKFEECAAAILSLPLNSESLVVARSMGAGLVLRLMTERNDIVLSKLILVAPWTDPLRNYGRLFDFKIDPTIPERVTNGITVFYSSQDDLQAQQSLVTIQSELPCVKYRNIPEYGHFMLGNTMTSEEFPELLEEI